ncbi:MAG: formylglycine-generating enzyme family protein [Gammaproteobacteria bacterium]|nr:formylglycine-generating enzyme family protein [Gammaproteobacteria bacterium]
MRRSVKRLTLLAVCQLVNFVLVGIVGGEPVELNVGAVFSDCANCPELVVVPAGRFTMGFDGGEKDRYEGPVRSIYISKSFAAGRFEVTTAEYARFILDSGHQSGKGCFVWDGRNAYMNDQADWRDAAYGRPSRAGEPVVCIDWRDAKAYTAWLAETTGQAYRLLTEAEWEYAARAGEQTTYTWGDLAETGCVYSNIFDRSAINVGVPAVIEPADCHDGHAGVAPVGSREPNPFGLYDMSGNVWEWVEDCYVMPYADGPVDGSAYQVSGSCEVRAIRGGSWITGISRQRPSFRGRDPEGRKSQVFGFRIARDLAR